MVLYTRLGLLSSTTAVGAAWSFARSPHWHRPIEASLCSAFQHKIGSTGLCQLAWLVRAFLLQGVQKILNKQTRDAMWEWVLKNENVTNYCKEGSSKLNCINGGGNKQAKDLWLVSIENGRTLFFFFKYQRQEIVLPSAGVDVLLCILCLTGELSTSNLHLTMACLTGTNNWTWHTSAQYRFSFVPELISCTTTQNKIHPTKSDMQQVECCSHTTLWKLHSYFFTLHSN